MYGVGMHDISRMTMWTRPREVDNGSSIRGIAVKHVVEISSTIRTRT